MHPSLFTRLMTVVAGALVLVVATASTNAQTLREKEKEWKSCEDGYYTGPREGRRSYTMDKYLWVVTPAFAKRFCMPESMVSDELKGAEAIAFRMVDGAENDKCRLDTSGKAHCMENSTARLEIYLRKDLNLPSTNLHVKFFYGEYTDSDRQLDSQVPDRGVGERLTRWVRHKKGEYRVPEGRLPRFGKLYDAEDLGHRFGLIFTQEGKTRWPVAPLVEVGFRGDWVDEIDLLVL